MKNINWYKIAGIFLYAIIGLAAWFFLKYVLIAFMIWMDRYVVNG